ncbi:alginate export family protein [Planctobacterium marinum]|uniref:Alginate export domain-containing protein n=1 Tax=Planctobacterium marinum TaxID=1631968 RepID=A0AA48KR87_9ALTE|nr:hypothetical protein MACH26_41170 [Planctobacterium marinum]
MRTHLKLLSIAVGLACTPVLVQASDSGVSSVAEAITESSVKTMLRYRYEGVDQDGLDEDASANTLLGRLTASTAKYNGWQAVVEFDYVTELLDKDYNNTINGNTTYPVVADPSGSDLNQSYLKYTSQSGTATTFGRQRINHNNQRFLGGVAWRQNEQTFDGVRFESEVAENFTLDYAYSYRVNRIFGSKNPNGDLDVDLHMFNAVYQPAKGHKIAGFYYSMDFDDALALSNSTAGFDYNFSGKSGDIGYGLHLSYASQKDTGDNPVDYSTDYYAIDGSVKVAGVTLAAGIEVLGADNGKGFQTPLATLHKFQGWTDKFLGTPGTGIEDTWFKVATKLGGVSVAAIYHQFDADEGSADLGSELGLVANYGFAKHYKLTAKYASYDADTHATDTDKVWIQLLAKY